MKKAVVSLFDETGKMLEPWRDAGFDCFALDVVHEGCKIEGGITKMHANLMHQVPEGLPLDRICFVAAFPPCDHLAVSGARWFKGKGLRSLARSIDMFATAAEFCEKLGVPYMIENPVSTISTYWRKPDHTFNPADYTIFCADDNYTKKTCLWVGGGFVMPRPKKDESLGEPDARIHKMSPGPDRKKKRSATPRGFARAVFAANFLNCFQIK